MASDELTQDLRKKDEDKTTQPTLTAVFELVREVKNGLDRLTVEVAELKVEVAELRVDVTHLSARLDAVESRLAGDIAGLGYKIEVLNKPSSNRSRLRQSV